MIRFVLALLLIATPASADNILLLGAGGKKPSATAAPPSYTIVGSAFDVSGAGTSISTTVDVGASSSQRVILIAVANPFASTTACTVNSNSATKIVSNGDAAAFYSLAGTSAGSGSGITVSCNKGAFHIASMIIYRLENLASTTLNQSWTWGSGTQAATFNQHDFVFAVMAATTSPPNYSSSTETPSNQCIWPAGTGCSIGGTAEGVMADWDIAAAGAFTINIGAYSRTQAAVSFR